MSACSSDTAAADEILQQCLAGSVLDFHNPSFRAIERIVAENAVLVHGLNATPHTPDEARRVLERMTLRAIDPSVSIATPLRNDFGRHIFFGKNIFINTDCLLVDLGGIYLADGVLLAPRVSIITVNHELEPAQA